MQASKQGNKRASVSRCRRRRTDGVSAFLPLSPNAACLRLDRRQGGWGGEARPREGFVLRRGERDKGQRSRHLEWLTRCSVFLRVRLRHQFCHGLNCYKKHRLCNLQLESSIIHKCGSEVVYVCPTGGGGERRPVARQDEGVSERGEGGKGEGDRREGVKVGQLLISS